MDFVTVRHPDVELDAIVSRAAFEVLYAEKGWEIVPDADEVTEPSAPQADAPAPVDAPAEPPAEAPVEPPAPSDTPIGDAVTGTPTPAPEV